MLKGARGEVASDPLGVVASDPLRVVAMPPKAAARRAAANLVANPGPPVDPGNAGHFERLQLAIDQIEAHPVMEGIKGAPPIPRGGLDPRTGKSGYKEVFNPITVAADLKAAGASEMAGNFFWQNSFLTPLAGIPFNSRAMELLQERNFKDPTAFPDKLLIAVNGPEADIAGSKGSWQHVTPDEIIHSYLFAIARDAAMPENHARMKNWRFFLLTASFNFIVCTGEDIYWRQARIREDTEVAFQVVQRSALQRVYEINMVLQRRTGQRSLSNAQLAELYQKHLQQVASTEKITTNYITEAVQLYKNLLCDPQARPGAGGSGGIASPQSGFFRPPRSGGVGPPQVFKVVASDPLGVVA